MLYLELFLNRRSSSINRDRMRKDRGAANGVAATLDGTPAHQMDPAAKPFFKDFLEGTHFKEPDVASGQKFDQQVDVAPRPARRRVRGNQRDRFGRRS